MGRSASAAVIVAYLMKAESMTLDRAYNRLRGIRPQVKINPGFIRQLKVWDVVKDDFNNRREYPEYKLWKMNRDAGVIAGTPSRFQADAIFNSH
jgi:protein-tyrosine phosphatase